MARRFPTEARRRFVDVVCEGSGLRAAALEVGVSPTQAVVWWREAGRMELVFKKGSRGGLGPVPAACPGQGTRRRALTSADRAVIAAGVRQGLTVTAIAELVGRNKSVVSRELGRNQSRDGSYQPAVAHRAAAVRRRRPKAFKLQQNPRLCRHIEGRMDEGWSPRLISQVLARDARSGDGACAGGDTGRVSHETIYQALYVQTRGQLRHDLHQQLSLKRRARVARGTTSRRGHLYSDAFQISERPAEVADRAVPGHWEGDLIVGTGGKSAIGTLVERTTRFTILLHLPQRHDADSVAEAMIREMGDLPAHLRRSITWDRGSELADYARIQLALEAKLFFCDPHSPWQRGTNENTNRLLRFWFEKGTDLSAHTAEDLRQVAATLNRRPRPTLDLETPAERLNKLLKEAA